MVRSVDSFRAHLQPPARIYALSLLRVDPMRYRRRRLRFVCGRTFYDAH